MSNFQYGGAWERFPIEKGKVCRIGNHKVMVGNVTKGDLSKLLDVEKIDLIFTDPPWDDRITKQFYKYGGEPQELNFNELIRTFLFEIKKYSIGGVFIEMGIRGYKVLQKNLSTVGAKTIQDFHLTYGQKETEYIIWYGCFNDMDLPTISLPSNLHGWDVAKFLIGHMNEVYNIRNILDPFVGVGHVLKIADKFGIPGYGLELNKRKLAHFLNFRSEA
jgi:hypothetical protein